MAKKMMFWTAALAGDMWTPLDERKLTAAQAVSYCEAELAARSGKMPNGEYEVTAIKAVYGGLTVMVHRRVEVKPTDLDDEWMTWYGEDDVLDRRPRG